MATICLASLAVAAPPQSALDWAVWQRIPVFDEGRMMPLDTFARDAVETICGRSSPRLGPDASQPSATATAANPMFPDGKPRKFTAVELLFSWTVEPQQWEDVPFLHAEHEGVRRDLLGLPLVGADGARLQYVSPRQVENAPALHRRMGELIEMQRNAQQRGQRLELVGVDKKVKDLFDAYELFRLLTFHPANAASPRDRYFELLVEGIRGWREVEGELKQFGSLDKQADDSSAIDEIDKVVNQIIELSQKEPFKPAETEPLLVAMRKSTAELAERYARITQQLFDHPPEWSQEQLRRIRAAMKGRSSRVAAVARTLADAQAALYDSQHALRLVPALNPAALEANRKTSDQTQPWASLPMLLYGSDALLAPYPQKEVRAVRQALAEAKAAYLARDDAARAERFAAASRGFDAALRGLGQAIEPIRLKLPIAHRDEDLLAATAYPPPGAVDAEVHYNRMDPFFWSWLADFLAVAAFGLSFGIMRRVMFWLGVGLLTLGQLLSCYGFGLRTYITGWAPVTGMFETVVFVALVAAMLGLWFVLLPLVWPGLQAAWRTSALPGTWEARGSRDRGPSLFSPAVWRRWNWIMLAPRIALAAFVFWVLAVYSYREAAAQAIIGLVPRCDVGSKIPSVMDLVTWLVGLGVLLPSVWYVPRLALTLPPAIVTIPLSWRRFGLARPLEQVSHRKPFVMVGAVVAFLVAFIAYYSPLWPKEIGSLTPVLRDRFWLYIHVLTITASYGAGALAFGLGMISLGYYLLGNYRADQPHPPSALLAEHRPAGRVPASVPVAARHAPEACAALGGFIYKTTQVAVLLLAAGTILGGLWADVAWGRFWGWDAKEVWALISLMVYLAVLHGRYAGWFGNFGLAAGSVLGASAIVMAWYGVNYYLRSGLHTYASGAGGQIYVGSFLLACWVFLIAAWLRCRLEMRVPELSQIPAGQEANG